MTRFKLSEHNYRYLFKNASDAMWVHDMDKWQREVAPPSFSDRRPPCIQMAW